MFKKYTEKCITVEILFSFLNDFKPVIDDTSNAINPFAEHSSKPNLIDDSYDPQSR